MTGPSRRALAPFLSPAAMVRPVHQIGVARPLRQLAGAIGADFRRRSVASNTSMVTRKA